MRKAGGFLIYRERRKRADLSDSIDSRVGVQVDVTVSQLQKRTQLVRGTGIPNPKRTVKQGVSRRKGVQTLVVRYQLEKPNSASTITSRGVPQGCEPRRRGSRTTPE